MRLRGSGLSLTAGEAGAIDVAVINRRGTTIRYLERPVKAGTSRVALELRDANGRKFRPGRHRLRVHLYDRVDNRSAARTVRFTVR